MIGCAAIILTGLSFKEKEKYLNFGLSLLKKNYKFFHLTIKVFQNQEIFDS